MKSFLTHSYIYKDSFGRYHFCSSLLDYDDFYFI